jgi:hypothetical protein
MTSTFDLFADVCYNCDKRNYVLLTNFLPLKFLSCLNSRGRAAKESALLRKTDPLQNSSVASCAAFRKRWRVGRVSGTGQRASIRAWGISII